MLQSGDRLKQPEFHCRYLQMPENQKLELVEGRVVMASPVSKPHAVFDLLLGTLLTVYRSQTPGTETMANGTVILDGDNEIQPDSCLWILPEFGGQTGLKNGKYISGAPEWVGEIAYSSAAIDLYEKRSAYERNGVLEYFVFDIPDQNCHLFDLRLKQEIVPEPDGILRSNALPGLWIDTIAFREDDAATALKALQLGLDSAEHGGFVDRLTESKRKMWIGEQDLRSVRHASVE